MNTILDNIRKKLNITTLRYVYLVIFAIPLNIHVLDAQLGIIIQWAFFRWQVTAQGSYLVPIISSLTKGLLNISFEYFLYEGLLFLGSLCFVLSYMLLFYRTTEPVRKAGLLTVSGAVLITGAYVLPLGPAGISIPVGMPFILVLGILMYWHQPEIPDTRSRKKRGAKSGNLSGTRSIPTESTPVTTDPSASQGIGLDYYISLVVLNFVTNFIFLPYYGFIGDDWSTLSPINEYIGIPVSQLLFESRRPFGYIIIKTLPIITGYNQVVYFLINFIVTSILLLVVFIVIRSLLTKIKIDSPAYAFLITVLYCILFNKGELYAFGITIGINIALTLYLVSFYFFMNSDKKSYYFPLSIVSFTIALFTYELGIILPFIYLIYAFYFEKSFKKPLAFFPPLLFYCSVRFTNWGGYGFIVNAGSGVIPKDFLSSLPGYFFNCKMNLVMLMDSFPHDVIYGISGLHSLPLVLLTGLIILDVIVASVLLWILNRHISEEPEKPEFKGSPLMLIGFFGIVLSFALISFNGFLAERYLVFIDVFACLIGVLITLKCAGKKTLVYGLFFIVIFCLIINQGLYFNWVVSGNIQHNFNEAVLKNSENISQSRFVYVNITDLEVVNGNYLNAGGLRSWSILSMMQNAGIKTSNITLIYNVEDENWKPYEMIENRSYFEFNRSNVDLSKIYFR